MVRGGAENGANVPLVVIAGARGTGKRRLLRALTQTEGSGEPPGPGPVRGRLETKYYSAVVDYQLLDVLPGEELAIPQQRLEAVILVWDTARVETFQQARRAAVALGCAGGGAEEPAEGDAGIRLCVGAARLSGSGAPPEDANGEARLAASLEEVRVWCADVGFEFLHCELDTEGLESIRLARARGPQGGTPLLAADDGADLDPADRVVEALFCHAWPNLVPTPKPAAAGGSHNARPARAAEGGAGAGSQGDEGTRRTGGGGEPAAAPAPAAAKEQPARQEEPGDTESEVARLQRRVAELEAQLREASRDRDARGAAAPEVPPKAEAPPTVTVPCGSQTLTGQATPAPAAQAPAGRDPPPKKAAKVDRDGPEDRARAVEAMERLAQDMRSVREISDDGQRRDRACELAMLLAEALGVDDEDSEAET